MRDTLLKISSEFTSALNEKYKEHPLANFIRRGAPKKIKNILPEEFKHYKTYARCGQNNWANIRGAWLAILNPLITDTAQRGYYVVYGFPAGSSEFVFGLAQGYKEAEDTYGSEMENALEQSASLMRLKIPKKLSNGFKTGRVEFSFSDSTKDQGYRVGYAYHKIYDSKQLPPEEELKEDLIKMLNAYKVVFSNGGRNLDFKIEDKKGIEEEIKDEDIGNGILVEKDVFPKQKMKLKKKRKFKGRKPKDYLLKEKVNKEIGNIGEKLVLKHEIKRLEVLGKTALANSVEHISLTEGDGTGYDIKSFNEDGSIRYIEVKTTKSGLNTDFYMSANEIDFSRENSENYFIYRVYDLDLKLKPISADLYICQGYVLDNYKADPTEYLVYP